MWYSNVDLLKTEVTLTLQSPLKPFFFFPTPLVSVSFILLSGETKGLCLPWKYSMAANLEASSDTEVCVYSFSF